MPEMPVSVTLPPASLKLLRQIAEHDHGAGVHFVSMPRARFKHPHTNTVFNGRSFWPLGTHGLVKVSESRYEADRITDAGRQYLAALDAARGGGR